MTRPRVRQAIDKPPRRAALTGRDRLMGFRFSRALRLATRVFWIAVFIAVFLLTASRRPRVLRRRESL